MEATDSTTAVRCDTHRSVMTKERIRFTDSQYEGPAFVCKEPDCTRYYMDDRGYFDVYQGRVLAEKFQQRCPKCASPMYLSGAEQEVEIWSCPTHECGQHQRLAS
jgi:hypothetical protein